MTDALVTHASPGALAVRWSLSEGPSKARGCRCTRNDWRQVMARFTTEQLDDLAEVPVQSERMAAEVRDLIEAARLDAAWQEAEAALPDDLAMYGVQHIFHETSDDPKWEAQAGDLGHTVEGYGSTPAAALRALAAKLRGEG